MSETNDKLGEILEKVNTIDSKTTVMERLLVGDLKNIEQPGLVERIRKIEQWIEKRSWFEKLIIASIFVEAIGVIFIAITK